MTAVMSIMDDVDDIPKSPERGPCPWFVSSSAACNIHLEGSSRVLGFVISCGFAQDAEVLVPLHRYHQRNL